MTTPFRIDEAEFFARVDTLCVLEVTVPFDSEEVEPRRKTFQALLVEGIRDAGHSVIEGKTLVEAWKSGFASVGDVFDPHTGRADPDRLALARERGSAALRALGCDALVRPQIAVVTAPFGPTVTSAYASAVEWDGASQPYGQSVLGKVAALSLRVRVEELDGELLYFGTGGIQPLAGLSNTRFSVKFEAIDDDDVLNSARRNRAAIALAIAFLRRAATDTE